jgi:cytochrome P450 monooxygenase
LPTSDELFSLTQEEQPLLGFSPSLRQLRGGAPVVRVRTPIGDEAWLVTRHAEIRQLLLDPRIGRSHPEPENAPKYLNNPMLDQWRHGDFATEPQAHAAMRTMLAPFFQGKRIGVLEPQVTRRVNEAVAQFSALAPPADIYTRFSLPLTARVLGDLLGVPEEDCDTFPALVLQLSDVADMQHAAGGRDALLGYMFGLVARKRAEPADDVVSGLAAAVSDDRQCAWLGLMLLFAGFGSTAKHTTLGIARMAGDPALRDRLAADPALMKPAVDEFLRTASSEGFTFPHYAREDIEIADVKVAAGDLLLLNYQLANFDESVFPAPDEIDITRSPNPHLTFSHGMWHCTGAPLARMQLTMTFNALLAALPGIRLAKPLEEMARTPGKLGELAELTVTW